MVKDKSSKKKGGGISIGAPTGAPQPAATGMTTTLFYT